jgi:4-carboxymuconolactone decarboxylase
MRNASLALTVALLVQIATSATGPRIAPVPPRQQSEEQRAIAAKYVSSEMPNAVATYLNHPALADHILPYEHYASADSTLQFARRRDRARMIARLPTDVPFSIAAKRTNLRLVDKEARIPPLEPREWTPEQRKRFDPNGTGQRATNVFVTFVRNPPADRLRGPINQHILNGTTLSVRQRETLLMRIGVLCRSEYEYGAHHRLGQRAGMTDADVARIINGPDSAPGDPLETAMLRATDELFQNDRVSDKTWAVLTAGFDTKQLLDVLIAVGGYRSTSMAINSAGVQLDANMADVRFPASLR